MFRLFCVMGFVLCACTCVAQQVATQPVDAQRQIASQPAKKPAVSTAIQPPAKPASQPSSGKKTYTSVLVILEDLPRKPEAGDNTLAAIPDNEWLKTNLYGCSLQATGKVANFSQTIQQPGQPGQLIKAAVIVRFADHREIWRQYDFTSRIVAFCDGITNDLSKLQPGDDVTVEGTVVRMAIEWNSERHLLRPSARGQITLELKDCKLIAESKGPAAESKPASSGAESKEAAGGTHFQGAGVHFRNVPTPATPEKPEGLMEVVPTSASDIEKRRLRVAGGWIVFTKWQVPSHTEMMCVFCPDPRHTWEMRSSPVKGTVTTAFPQQVGSQVTPTPPLRPLGTNLTVDKNGIIWERGKPVGTWGVESGEPSRSRSSVVPPRPPIPSRRAIPSPQPMPPPSTVPAPQPIPPPSAVPSP